jgi:hypothetical protein
MEEKENQSFNKISDLNTRLACPAVLEEVVKSNLLSPHTTEHRAYRTKLIFYLY